jgi:3-hydroxypropionyl-CoA synthetase (ADP-forming)
VIKTSSTIIRAALDAHKTHLTEVESKALCREFSIPTPQFELATSEEHAPEAAKRLGFPLVAKVVSQQVIHKTESGGVVLNINSAEAAKTAYSNILHSVKTHYPQAEIEGVLMEKMEPPGIEVIVGATNDPQFGKTLMFGMGGILVEALRDVTFKLAPITDDEARQMLENIHSHQLLSGYRGSPPADKHALIQILKSTSELVTKNEEILELDLNPIIVHEHGAVAVDARVILSEESPPADSFAPTHQPNSLMPFFKPKSVAVIGASSTPGKIGHEVLRSLTKSQYSGKIYPINPTSNAILDLKAYSNISNVPEKVELAVLTVPAKLTPSIMDECGRKGVKAAVIVSGGFKEVGMGEIEKETIQIARKYGVRVIGPNCIGVFDGHSRLDTFFQSDDRMLRPKAGLVSFITQSGTFGATILEWAAEEDVGISKFVSYGNRCDVDEGDLIEFLAEDDETAIIGIYAEGFDKGRKLYEAARKVTSRKPIVILKSGKTRLGSKAAKSHTGWLAGSYEIAKAAFEQAGIIVAEDLYELWDTVKVLSMQPLPTGRNLAMVTNGAGPCVMTADKIEQYGMTIAPVASQSVSALTKKLSPYCFVSETTVDLTGSATSNDYEVALQILAQDPAVNILIPFFVFQDTPLDEGIVKVLGKIKHAGKPMVCCASGGPHTRSMSKRVQALGIPVYETAERTANAVHALVLQAEITGKARHSTIG